jgi:hypothetical protein
MDKMAITKMKTDMKNTDTKKADIKTKIADGQNEG